MRKSDIGVGITKPISLWNKPLKSDFKDLFKSLSETVIHSATGSWKDAAISAAGVLSAIGIKTDPGEVAWFLIRRSLARAIFELVADSLDLLTSRPEDVESFCEEIDLGLENEEMSICAGFFEQPSTFPLIDKIKTPFSQWLEGFGLDTTQAATVSAHLPSYFVYSLNNEWRENAQEYAPLKNILDTPFTNASIKEQAWYRYASWLVQKTDQPIFGASFSLRQIFVPLRATYSKKSSKDVPKFESGREEDYTFPSVVWLEAELDSWLSEAKSTEALRVISGDPGCGKSAFATMFAARETQKGKRKVLFIPLYLLEPSEDFTDAIGEFVRNTGLMEHNPLDPQSGDFPLLLILDGLDELTERGKLGTEVAEDFIREVQRTLDRLNMVDTRVQVLVTGRTLIIQNSASQFRRPQQTLQILPYYLGPALQSEFDDPQGLLEEDQRDIWWRKYGECIGEPYTGLPDELSREDLEEITAQPLLNYLFALSLANKRLDFSTTQNLNSIYFDLLVGVYERGWGEKKSPGLEPIGKEEFIAIMEEVALAAWQGPGRTATVKAIEQKCDDSGLKEHLAAFNEGAEAGVTRLLAAFYFRQLGYTEEGDRAFAFTHKSFGEYLVARRIVRGMRRIYDERQRRKSLFGTGWKEEDALRHWYTLCAATQMDGNLFYFVMKEVELQGEEEVAEWQKAFAELIQWVVREGLYINPGEESFRRIRLHADNTEEALLAVLNACARVTGICSQVDWPYPTRFADWYGRLQGQRTGPYQSALVMSCLGYLDLRECKLDVRDFFGANLSDSCMQNAEINLAIFDGADMRNVDLNQVRGEFTTFRGANLQDADLREGFFFEADFRGAILMGAKFEKAFLKNANFEGASLGGTNFDSADVAGARFEKANVDPNQLDGAINIEEISWIEAPAQAPDELPESVSVGI